MNDQRQAAFRAMLAALKNTANHLTEVREVETALFGKRRNETLEVLDAEVRAAIEQAERL